MKIKSIVKSWVLKNIDSRFFEFINSKYVYITKVPKSKHDVISDLFPLRIQNNWNSYFELLNIPKLINPKIESKLENNIQFHFFNSDGSKVGQHEITLNEELKTTINLKSICNDQEIHADGTFAIFHTNPLENIANKGSFMTERGYVGYENKKLGPIKGYVHGNFDAISMGKITSLLGKTSFRNKRYNIQYEFEDDATYELFWVNPSKKSLNIKIIDVSNSDKKNIIKIKPGGLKSYIYKSLSSKKRTSLIIESKLNLARPIIFKYMETSFDVFHG